MKTTIYTFILSLLAIGVYSQTTVTLDLSTGTNPDGSLMETTNVQDTDWAYVRPDNTVETPITRHTYTGWSYPQLEDGLERSVWLRGDDYFVNGGYYNYVTKTFTIPEDATDVKLNLRSLSFVRNWTYLVKVNEDETLTETEITKTTWMDDGAKGWLNSRSPIVTDLSIAPGDYFIKVRVYSNNSELEHAANVNANLTYASSITEPIIGDFYYRNSLGVKDLSQDASVMVYPNPIMDKLQLKSKVSVQGVEVYSANGTLVQQYNFEGQKTIILQTNQLEKGIYILKIKTENGIITKKVVKK